MRSSKGVWIGGSSKMKIRRRKELIPILTPKVILQKNVIRRNKIQRTNSKVLHK